jgi:hypothetical protein
MKPGYRSGARRQELLRVGNASGVEIAVDGVSIEPLGGKVVEGRN